MQNISMLNPYSIKHVWNYNEEGKKYITNLINNIIKTNEKYILLDYYNKNINNVRSYSIFKSKKHIVLIDFIYYNRNIDDDKAIITFLKNSTNKKIFAIIFNYKKGDNYVKNNFYYIYNDQSFLFQTRFNKQLKYNESITKILYKMNTEYIKLYQHEKMLLKN